MSVLTVQCYKTGLPSPTVEWFKIVNATNGTEGVPVKIRDGMIKVSLAFTCILITMVDD